MKSVVNHLSKLSLGVLALVAGLNSAQAITLANASASLTNLKITLVDLDPNDGIAPSVTFAPGTLTSAFQFGGDEYSESSLPIGNTLNTTLTGSYGPASYQFSPNGITLSIAVDSSSFTPAGFNGPDQSYYISGGGANVSYGNAYDPDSPDFSVFSHFTLSANTGLFITGTASANASVAREDQVLALAKAQFDPSTADLEQLSIYSGANASLSFQLASLDALNGWLGAPNTSTSNFTRDAGVEQDYGIYEATDAGDFALSFANGAAQSVEAGMLFSMQVGGGADAYAPALVVPELPQVPTIPEPSTYLLMGLGLVGIGWARSRHQAAQRA